MGIKITRKMLDDYRKNKREIPLMELDLELMKQGDNGFNNSTIFDYRTGEPRPQSVVGFDWDDYYNRQDKLDKKKAEVKAVEKWINAIEDGQARIVFKWFYIDGVPWLKISEKIKYTGDCPEDYPRVCIRDAYLKKVGMLK